MQTIVSIPITQSLLKSGSVSQYSTAPFFTVPCPFRISVRVLREALHDPQPPEAPHPGRARAGRVPLHRLQQDVQLQPEAQGPPEEQVLPRPASEGAHIGGAVGVATELRNIFGSDVSFLFRVVCKMTARISSIPCL